MISYSELTGLDVDVGGGNLMVFGWGFVIL